MLLFMKKRVPVQDPENQHWVEVPCPHHTYEDTVEYEDVTETVNGKPYTKKQEIRTGLGSFVVHIPRIGEEYKTIAEWRFEQIRYWRRFANAGIDKFHVDWVGTYAVRLTNDYGGIEFRAQSGPELTPLRKVFARHIAVGVNGDLPPYQIRVTYQGATVRYVCEARTQEVGKKNSVESPECGVCGAALVRATVPKGFVLNESQKYWKCATEGCEFELAEPPLTKTPPPAVTDLYATMTLPALVEICAERDLSYRGMDKSDIIIALRKYDASHVLEGAAK